MTLGELRKILEAFPAELDDAEVYVGEDRYPRPSTLFGATQVVTSWSDDGHDNDHCIVKILAR